MSDLFYGNFAEPKEEKTSKRSEEVVLSAITRCELLDAQLKRACELIGRLEKQLQEEKEKIDALKG